MMKIATEGKHNVLLCYLMVGPLKGEGESEPNDRVKHTQAEETCKSCCGKKQRI